MKRLMNQRWFIALVFMVLFKPTIISQMPGLEKLDSITDIFKIAVLFVLLLWFVCFYQRVSLFFVTLTVLQAWRIICTLYNGGNYTSLFLTIFNALAIALVVEMGLKTDPDALLDGATFMLGVYALCNFATILMHPNGMYAYNQYTENYFFGYRNNMVMMILPAMIFSVVRSLKYYNRLSKSSVIIIISSIISVAIAFSANSAIGMTIMAVVIIMTVVGLMPKVFNIATYIIINAFYFFGIIVMRVQEYFAFIIVGLLNRDLTFTGRTEIWDKALRAFMESPIFGVGEITSSESKALIGATHAHNYYLDLLYKSGIFGLVLFIAILVMCGLALYKTRKNGKIPFFVSGALFAFMIMLQNEAYYNIYYYFSVLALAAFISYALPQKDKDGNPIFRNKKLKKTSKDLIDYGIN